MALTAALLDAGRENAKQDTAELLEALRLLISHVPDLDMPDMPDSVESTGSPEPVTAPSDHPGPHTPPDPDKAVREPLVLPGFPRPPGPSYESESRQTSVAVDDTPALAPGFALSLVDAPAGTLSDVPGEFGGLIGAVEDWANEGTVFVNTGRPYRLMNHIAEIYADAASLVEAVEGEILDNEPLCSMAWGLSMATEALQADVLSLASLPLSTLTVPLPQLVTYLSNKLGKNVELRVSGDTSLLVDRHVLEAISEPVRRLIVNAVYHGLAMPGKRKMERKPAQGSLTVDLSLSVNMLELVVADDGAGVDWNRVHATAVELRLVGKHTPVEAENLESLLFEAGVSTGAIDGPGGDGLTKLAESVEHLHGRVQLESWPGDGTRVSLRVPARQALQKMLIVRSGGVRWAIPESAVEHTMLTADAGEPGAGVPEMDWDGRLIPFVPFSVAVGLGHGGTGEMTVILSHRVGTAAFTVDEVEAGRNVAVNELARLVAAPDHVTGFALLAHGDVALVVDAGRLVESIRLVSAQDRSHARVLVYDDSESGRGVLSGSLSASGFITSLASTVGEALGLLGEVAIDAVVVDFALPTASGVALVEEVRRRDRRMPIVMLSDVASEDDKTRAKLAGVDRFFHKSDLRGGALVSALWELIEA